jgi:hypothetical protein
MIMKSCQLPSGLTLVVLLLCVGTTIFSAISSIATGQGMGLDGKEI